MKITPIIFSTPMVQALLDGRKTQTRRIVKPQPGSHMEKSDRAGVWLWVHDWPEPNLRQEDGKCPYGQPGDLLYVRETFGYIPDVHRVDYKASSGAITCEARKESGLVWKPSIHMPRWASRLTLKLTDVRGERLQDISQDDCLDEGIDPDDGYELDDVSGSMDYRPVFGDLWDEINGQGAWMKNPWVWVLSFGVINQNVDEYTNDPHN